MTSTSSTSRSSTLGRCGCRRRRAPHGPCASSPGGAPGGALAAPPAGPAGLSRCAPCPAGVGATGGLPSELPAAAPPAALQSAASILTQSAGAPQQGAWPHAQTLPGVGGSGPAHASTLVAELAEQHRNERTLPRRRGSTPTASPASAIAFIWEARGVRA
jgi:hypothetical protein